MAAARSGDAHQGSTGPQVDGGSPVLPSSAEAQVREPAMGLNVALGHPKLGFSNDGKGGVVRRGCAGP